MFLNHLNVLEQLAQAFQSIVFTLNRNQDFLCRHESINGQQSKTRRTVDKYIVEPSHPLLGTPLSIVLQSVFKAFLTCHDRNKFNLCPGKVYIRGRAPQIVEIRALLHNIGKRSIVNQGVISTGKLHAMLNTESRRSISLRVIINDQNVHSRFCKGGRNVHGGTRFTDSTLLIRDGKDACMWGLGQ